MATIEVHDDCSRVRRLTISRAQTTLFGASPECQIVLDGEGVLPIHGRLRWKGGRFKVDAAPDAHYVERNGKKVRTASLRMGDELRVGGFRIYMINPEEGPEDDASEGRTEVRPPPVLKPVLPPEARPAEAKTEVRARPGLVSDFADDDWVEVLEVVPPSVDMPGPPPASTPAREVRPADAPSSRTRRRSSRPPTGLEPEPGTRRKSRRKPKAEPATGSEGSRGRSWAARLRGRAVALLKAGEQAPGEERVLRSPLVIGLLASLILLVGMGVWLRGVIARTTADRLFRQAVEGYDNGEYRNAIRGFDDFLAAVPTGPRAGKARVLRGLAEVGQYALSGQPSWSNALEAAEAMFARVGGDPAFRDEATELARLVLKAAEGLADRARQSGDRESLAQAESAVALHARIAGEGADAALGRSVVPARLDQARASVRRFEARASALAAMDAALKAGSAVEAYRARDELVGSFPDLADDRAIVERLIRANALIRDAVRFDPSGRPAETIAPDEPLGPPTSLVLRAGPDSKSPGGSGSVVYAMAEGFASGLDGATGAPLWQVPVGPSAPFAPIAVPGGRPSALVVDARHDDLIRIDGRTGALAWRQPLEEPIAAPPLILGNQVIQPTPGGRLLLIDLQTGAIEGTLHLGRPLGPTPLVDESGRFLYLLASGANLFIVRRDPIGCESVEYTGHDEGSVICPPARIGPYLIVAENRGLADGRWTVYELREEKTRLERVQRLDVPGWTWSTPVGLGSIVWAVGDRGGPLAFAVGRADEPLKPLARLAPDLHASGPAFARARSEREVWISSGRSGRFDLDPERKALVPAWTLAGAGPAAGPIQVADRLVVLTHQAVGYPSGVALWGVDPTDGSVRWRTVLGAPWPAAPSARPDGGIAILAPDGRRVLVDRASLDRGRFVDLAIPGPGGFQLPAGPLRELEADGLAILAADEGAAEVRVRSGTDRWKPVPLPSTAASTPLAWGADLLVPGEDGRVSLIDPKTGASRAEPFVPPFDRDRPVRWLRPARLGPDAVLLADASGRVRRLIRSEMPGPRLVVEAGIDLDAPLASGPAAIGSAVLLATTDGQVRALSGRDLAPLGAWDLEAPLAFGPAAVGGLGLVVDRAGAILAFDPDGQRLWSAEGDGVPPAGLPAVADGVVSTLDRDGILVRRSSADGTFLERIDLRLLPAGGPIADTAGLLIPEAPGTIRPLLDTSGTRPISSPGGNGEGGSR